MCNVFNSIATAPVKQQLPVFDQFAIQSDGDIGAYNRDVLRNITYDINNNARQWSWQVCTEFGWFQIPNSVEPMRSDLLGPDFWLQWCKTSSITILVLPRLTGTTHTMAALTSQVRRLSSQTPLKTPGNTRV